METRQAKIQSYQEEKEVLVGVNKYRPEETDDDLSDHKIFADHSDNISFEETFDIPSLEPLHLEAELQKGDA
jgi:methylmalonyl-CoA mutase N-terminal domain/subunit